MKVVILAGGFGTRFSEESRFRPKPLVEIGGIPILWHIMKLYSSHGFHEFIICLGYKGTMIKEFFAKYALAGADVTFDFADGGAMTVHRSKLEPWKVTLVDTGLSTLTGGRLKRIRPYLEEKTFMMTYGDGLASVNISKLADFHRKHRKLATVTAVQPHGRFGALQLGDQNRIKAFHEKPKGDGQWINGGFFVLEPGVLDLIEDDNTVWEQEPLRKLARLDQLMAYKFTGFWHPMDTLRDQQELETLWLSGKPPWLYGEESP